MSASKSTYSVSDDPTKNVVVFINDSYEEYERAFQRLSDRLGRPLRGVMLVDKTLKEAGKNLPAPVGMFEELVCDFSNDAELRRTIKQFEDKLLLVSCSSEKSQTDFRRVLPHVPYVLGPTERSLEWATHKGKMREVIGAYDSRLVPKVQPVASAAEEEIRKVLYALDFPVIIKPTGLADSTLVAKVHDEAELRDGLRKSFAALHDTYKRNRGNGEPGIIVEEFMEGNLYSVDGYVNEFGQIWLLPLLQSKSAYHMGLEGFYIYQAETYHQLTEQDIADGEQAAESAMRAIGLRSSVAHVELYKTSEGWKVIEIGARPGGLRQEIYEVSYGVDHALNELLIKVGLPPEMGSGLRVHSMSFRIFCDSAGRVHSVEGVQEARSHPAVYKVSSFVERGQQVLPVTQGGSVAIQGLMFNQDVEQLRRDVAHVRSNIKVHTATEGERAKLHASSMHSRVS